MFTISKIHRRQDMRTAEVTIRLLSVLDEELGILADRVELLEHDRLTVSGVFVVLGENYIAVAEGSVQAVSPKPSGKSNQGSVRVEPGTVSIVL